MLAFFLRRLIHAAIVMLIVGLISFSLVQFIGDPVAAYLGLDVDPADRARLAEALGLNEPFLVRYLDYIARALSGDFGLSYATSRPVVEMIGERFPATFELALVASLMAIALGIPLGVFTALHPRSWLSRLFLTASLVGVSIPTFVIGVQLIHIFSVNLGWLPSYGRGETVDLGGWTTGLLSLSGWQSILMPAFSLALVQLTLIMRLVRAEMLEVLRADFIKFARARGLRRRSIDFGHALKNTMIPVITVIGLQIGTLIAFAIVTETVFQWPGMGLLFIQSVGAVDVPVMTAFLMVVAVIFVLINFVVDLLYLVVDPRLRGDRSGPAVAGGANA
ncbi:MAG: ABC transporter permease [Azospirillaceae bacterium]